MAATADELLKYTNSDSNAPEVDASGISFTGGVLAFGTATSGAGASRTIKGQAAASGSGAAGGNLVLQTGAKDGAGANGKVTILAGAVFGVEVTNQSTHTAINGLSGDLFLFAVAGGGAFVRIHADATSVDICDIIANRTSFVRCQLSSSTYYYGWVGGATGIGMAATQVVDLNNSTPTVGATLRSIPLAVSVAASQNDYAIGTARTIILNNTSGGSIDITSIGISQVNGQEFSIILNAASSAVVLKNASGSGTAANRFLCNTGADITLSSTNKRADFLYNATASRWEVR